MTLRPPSSPVRLLVSVRSADEALNALAGGAQLIDVKEPNRGALGAANAGIVSEVIAAVAGRVPVSAALGELSQLTGQARANADAILTLSGLTYAKVGLAGLASQRDWSAKWRSFLRQFPPSVRPVAVIYADMERADSPTAEEILHHAQSIPAAAMLIDTFGKDSGTLFDVVDDETLAAWVRAAHQNLMLAVLAGSLCQHSIPRAMALAPDWMAVRGAACRGDRTSAIDVQAVAELNGLLRAKSRQTFVSNA